MMSYAKARARMVERQLMARGIRAPGVLQAMREVPREAFVPEMFAERAYDDHPLPIEAGQTISQPFMVAVMVEAAGISNEDRVLEIGAGSGYAAAVMSRIAARVYAIERHPELARLAADRMTRLGYDNVEIRAGDGTHGWAEAAPFDVIIASAGAPHVPEPLKDQLDIGGRLVIPVGVRGAQRLVRLVRESATLLHEHDLGDVVFVPLIGAHGWKDEDASEHPH